MPLTTTAPNADPDHEVMLASLQAPIPAAHVAALFALIGQWTPNIDDLAETEQVDAHDPNSLVRKRHFWRIDPAADFDAEDRYIDLHPVALWVIATIDFRNVDPKVGFNPHCPDYTQADVYVTEAAAHARWTQLNSEGPL